MTDEAPLTIRNRSNAMAHVLLLFGAFGNAAVLFWAAWPPLGEWWRPAMAVTVGVGVIAWAGFAAGKTPWWIELDPSRRTLRIGRLLSTATIDWERIARIALARRVTRLPLLVPHLGLLPGFKIKTYTTMKLSIVGGRTIRVFLSPSEVDTVLRMDALDLSL